MKVLFGFALIVGGVAFGLYAGLWWAFIGGIVDVIREVRADNMDAGNVAIGVLKFMFAGFIGYVAAAVLLLPGIALVKS
jgi:phage-related minor tail protein